MTTKKILFYPSHDPEQYYLIAKKMVSLDSSIEPIFFLLNKPQEKPPFRYYCYEDLIDSINIIDHFNDAKFGCSLNELILLDRIHKSGMNLKVLLAKFRIAFYELVKKESFSAVFGYALSDSITYATYFVCKSLRIKYFFISAARCEDYYHLSTKIDGSAVITAPINNFSKKDVLEKLQNKTINKIVPSYASDKTMLIDNSIFSRVKTFFALMVRKFGNKNKYLATSPGPLEALKFFFQRRTSFKEHNDSLTNFSEIKQKKYIFYPLHLHPETATLIWGRWLYNQYEILRMIARVLPSDVYLVVKEHKVAMGRHERGFYRSIAALPNTVLINPENNPHDVIHNSIGVATISGTAGLENICHGKPTLLFGEVCFMDLPNIIKVRNISKMRDYINMMLEDDFVKLENNQELIDYMQAKINCSVQLFNYNSKSTDDELIDVMATLYLNAFNSLEGNLSK